MFKTTYSHEDYQIMLEDGLLVIHANYQQGTHFFFSCAILRNIIHKMNGSFYQPLTHYGCDLRSKKKSPVLSIFKILWYCYLLLYM